MSMQKCIRPFRSLKFQNVGTGRSGFHIDKDFDAINSYVFPVSLSQYFKANLNIKIKRIKHFSVD